MFEDLLPAVEKGILNAAGSIPVVFKGMERSFEKGASTAAHSRHDFHELIYLRSGKVEFDIEGRKLILDRGAALVIRPRKAHDVRTLEGHADMMVVYFGFSRQQPTLSKPFQMIQENASGHPVLPKRTTDIAPATLEHFLDYANGQDHADEGRTLDPFIQIKGKSRQDIAALMERVLRETRADAFARGLMLQLLAVELLVVLSRGLREEWEESLRVRTGKARELVKIARDYIVENHDRDISVADAAGYVFLSQGYFTRAFRDETGMSPMAFMMQVRVDHACKLLEQRDIKVSGIAEQVGFSSPQRFNAAFRKHVGMTPMAYRKQVLARKGGNIEKRGAKTT